MRYQFRHLTIKTRYPRFHLTRVMMSFRRVDVTPGFEPEMTESKSVVLPLHHITISSRDGNRTHTRVAANRILSPACLPVPPLDWVQLLDLISELPTVSTND